MDKANLKQVRDGYDRIAAEYSKRSFDELRHKPFDRYALDMLATHAEGVVCDLGCGPGQVARYLRDQGVKEVMGIDLSGAMVAQARRLNPDIEFLEANMYRLPARNEAWGAIVAFYSLIHIPRREVPQVLREFRRVLRTGGLLLIAFHLGQQTLQSKRWWDIPVTMDYTHFLTAEIQSYLIQAGFCIEGFRERPPYASPYFWESASYRGYVLARKLPTAPKPSESR